MLPAPPTPRFPPIFSFLPEREGGASRPSLPPTPAVPGHFCRLGTFPPRGHPGPAPSWAAGGTDGLSAQDPSACPRPGAAQVLPASLPPPSPTEEAALPRPGRPARPGCALAGLVRRDRAAGPAPSMAIAPGLPCRALAGRPGRGRTGRGEGPAGWRARAAAAGGLAAAAGFEPRGTPRRAGTQHHYHPPSTHHPTGKPWPQTNPGSSPGAATASFVRVTWGTAFTLSSLQLISDTYITPAGWEPQRRQLGQAPRRTQSSLIPRPLFSATRQEVLSLETELPATSRPPSAIRSSVFSYTPMREWSSTSVLTACSALARNTTLPSPLRGLDPPPTMATACSRWDLEPPSGVERHLGFSGVLGNL